MRYIVTFFWTAILGAVIGYIGSALQNAHADYQQTIIVALVTGSIGAIASYFISKAHAPKVVMDSDEDEEA
ncbi:YjzD family protein [Weissella diestrammenae]|uniref:YjzD family protein n=2 Tax=Weissella diestrammenae TaxID=1162633 RepID=A0A7G9T7G3_9LACO|nr:YjzD family protein [Weissella diestrammenae]MCM0582267.1 YjzD family protein [Weissella diestrammenae]QNN76038.1 YjzD family protein [Weissella diestrammenae]